MTCYRRKSNSENSSSGHTEGEWKRGKVKRLTVTGLNGVKRGRIYES